MSLIIYDSNTVYFLENLDGMFSYCKNEAMKNWKSGIANILGQWINKSICGDFEMEKKHTVLEVGNEN